MGSYFSNDFAGEPAKTHHLSCLPPQQLAVKKVIRRRKHRQRRKYHCWNNNNPLPPATVNIFMQSSEKAAKFPPPASLHTHVRCEVRPREWRGSFWELIKSLILVQSIRICNGSSGISESFIGQKQSWILWRTVLILFIKSRLVSVNKKNEAFSLFIRFLEVEVAKNCDSKIILAFRVRPFKTTFW